MSNSKKKLPFRLIVFLILFLASLIADGVDIFAYRSFMKEHGIGWLDSPGWKLAFEYFTTFPGNFLTFVGLSPWIIALIYLSWPRKLRLIGPNNKA